MRSTRVKRNSCARTNAWLLLGVLVAVLPLAASTARIYVTNRGGTTISVIDPATNKVVETITGVEGPEVVRFSPDGNRVYIVARSEDVLDVRDRKSGKTIKKIPISGWGNDAMVTPDGKLIVICIFNTTTGPDPIGALDIIDTKSLEKIKTIPTKGGLHDIAVTGDGKFAAAGSPVGRSLTVFDLQKMEIAWEVQYDQGVVPLTIESGPDGAGRRIFAQLSKTNGFSVVDFATHKEVDRIIYPIDPKGYGNSCEGMSHGIGIAPDGKTLWANSRTVNSVFAYSLPDLKVLGRVPLPEVKVLGKEPRSGGPAWITFTPDSKTVYVSTCGARTVTAIDVNAMKEVARIPVGEVADRISTLVVP
jgi:YVTN family beta-propeller protein